MKISNNGENVLSDFFVFNQGGDYFKLLRFTVELRPFKLLSFAQASTHIPSANAKKSKWQIFGPSNHRAKNQNFRNSKNYIPLNPDFYADHYSKNTIP